MEERPRPMTNVAMLGASLVVVAGLLWLWTSETTREPRDVAADIVITDAGNGLLFNATGVELSAGRNTVLELLLEASRLGNFTVNVAYGLQGGAFVDEIAGIRNQGPCGWVYEVNDERAGVAANQFWLSADDRVHWRWGCE